MQEIEEIQEIQKYSGTVRAQFGRVYMLNLLEFIGIINFFVFVLVLL